MTRRNSDDGFEHAERPCGSDEEIPGYATGCVLLTHEVGLHARPALRLTKLAKSFSSRIWLAASEQGPWIDAKSVNKIMQAKLPRDTTLFFKAAGDDALNAIDALMMLVKRDFQNDGPGTAKE